METNAGIGGANGGARLVLTRRKAGADKLRSYKILLDGEQIGTMKEGTTFTADIAPGTHELQLKIDWGKSPIDTFEVKEGGEARFWCQSKTNPFTAIFYAIFGANRYVTLEPEDPAAA